MYRKISSSETDPSVATKSPVLSDYHSISNNSRTNFIVNSPKIKDDNGEKKKGSLKRSCSSIQEKTEPNVKQSISINKEREISSIKNILSKNNTSTFHFDNFKYKKFDTGDSSTYSAFKCNWKWSNANTGKVVGKFNEVHEGSKNDNDEKLKIRDSVSVYPKLRIRQNDVDKEGDVKKWSMYKERQIFLDPPGSPVRRIVLKNAPGRISSHVEDLKFWKKFKSSENKKNKFVKIVIEIMDANANIIYVIKHSKSSNDVFYIQSPNNITNGMITASFMASENLGEITINFPKNANALDKAAIRIPLIWLFSNN